MLKRILVPLDTILDTRLGVISGISSEAATRLTSSDHYWLREHNDWYKLTGGLITNEQFDKAYALRGGENTKQTISNSVLTGIVPFIIRIMGEFEVNSLNDLNAQLDEIALVVNYYPYVFNADELEVLEDSVKDIFGTNIILELISIPDTLLTPQLFDREFAMYIPYDSHEWIHQHHEALAQVRMPCFNFVGPKLFEKDVSKLTIDQKKAELTRFRLEKLIYMSFDFIDVKYFSMFRV